MVLTIDVVARPATASDIDQLAVVLADAVDSGASVSFMQPFSVDAAREWWRPTLERADPRATRRCAETPRSLSIHPPAGSGSA